MRSLWVLLLLANILLLFAESTYSYSYIGCDKPNKLLCQDVFSANECGVLDLCVKIWNSHPWRVLTNDQSASCIYCQFMGDNNRSGVVDWACKRLQTSSDTYEYKKLTSLLQFQNHMDGGEVMCNVLSACKSYMYVGDLNFGGTLCDDCKKVIDEVRERINSNDTAEVITDILVNVICEHVPNDFRNFCINNVKIHVPAILQLIANHAHSDEICRYLDLCPGNSFGQRPGVMNAPRPVTKKPCPQTDGSAYSWISRPDTDDNAKWTSYNRLPVNQPDCGECNAVLKVIQTKMSDPNLQHLVTSEVKKQVCGSLPLIEKVCEAEVDSQSHKVFDTITHGDTNDVCRYFGMCSTAAARGAGGSFYQTLANYYQSPQLPLTEGIPVPGVCQLCELVVSKVVELVLQELTEEKITAALDKVCQLLPSAYEKECEQLVKQYGPLIVEALIRGSTPKLVCASIGLCQSSPQRYPEVTTVGGEIQSMSFVRQVIPLLFFNMFQSPGVGDVECEMCHKVQDAVNSALNDAKVLETLKKAIEALCEESPWGSNICIKFIDDNFDSFIANIKIFTTNPEMCYTLGICPPSKDLCSTRPDYPCSSLPAAIECSSVQHCFAEGKLSNLLAVNQSLCDQLSLADACAVIELAHACGRQDQCQLYRMAALLQSALAPPPAAGLSPLSTAQAGLGQRPPAAAAPTVAVSCGICRQLVEEISLRRQLYGMVATDLTRCVSFQNEDERKQCGSLVVKLKEIMPDIISGQLTGLQICQNHALCESSDTGDSRRTSSFGSSCADGPLYWCSSPSTAAACNAENYCKAFGYSVTDRPASSPTTESGSGDKPKDVFGQNACAYGPTFWCQSPDKAKQCGAEAVRHCQTTVWVASTPCSWGPSFWCASVANAEQCDRVHYCKARNKRLQKRTG